MFQSASLQYDEQQNAVVNQSGTAYDIDKSLDNGILIGKDHGGDKLAAIPESHPYYNMIFFHTIGYDCLDNNEDRDMLYNLMTKILNTLVYA